MSTVFALCIAIIVGGTIQKIAQAALFVLNNGRRS